MTLDDFNEGNVVPVRPGTKTPVCNMSQFGKTAGAIETPRRSSMIGGRGSSSRPCPVLVAGGGAITMVVNPIDIAVVQGELVAAAVVCVFVVVVVVVVVVVTEAAAAREARLSERSLSREIAESGRLWRRYASAARVLSRITHRKLLVKFQ